ncbi:MAG: hypothetical protein QXY10_00740 [Candidatus Micrarchaeaceae archaeon]
MPNDNTLYEKLERYGNLMVDAETYLLEGEMNRGLGAISKIVPEELANKLEPYFIACGVLDIAGMDISKSNIQNMFVAADLIPNRLLTEGVGMLHYRNHLVYILAIIFLKSLNKEITKEVLLGTVEALDILPDVGMARYAIDVYNKLAPKWELEQIAQI